MSIAPEILAEQVMGYVIGAVELIPTLKPPLKPYDIAILPQGPHFYTGLLRAAGYLLLDDKKKKVVFISQQEKYPNRVIIEYSKYESLGKQRTTDNRQIKKIANTLGADIATKGEISQYVTNQLPFLAVISDRERILHIGIGKNISQTKMKEIISLITHHHKEWVSILLTNIELPPNTKKNNEQNQITKAMATSEDRLVGIFHKTLHTLKKKPEVIAYVNPGDFGIASVHNTRYVCVVG